MNQVNCPHCQFPRYRIHGYYNRQSNGERLTRWQCYNCERTFSTATLSPYSGQKKREINSLLAELMETGISERKAARILGVTRKTIRKRILFLRKLNSKIET